MNRRTRLQQSKYQENRRRRRVGTKNRPSKKGDWTVILLEDTRSKVRSDQEDDR